MNAVLAALIPIGTFIVFLYIIGRLFAGSVGRLLSQRSQRIETSLREADENLRRAEESQRESQRQLDQAHAEAQTILASAQKAATAQRESLVAQAEDDARALVARMHAEVQRERQAAVDELRREAGRLAVLAAGRVVSNALDETSNRSLADQAINDVGGGQ